MNREALELLEKAANKRREEILTATDAIKISKTVYYVSNEGNDENDGRSPESPWRSLNRVNSADLRPGDCVRFKRGDLFRGGIKTRPGVSYAAYGEGEKPKIYGWIENLANGELWELYDGEKNIWKYKKKITDCGTLVFNDGRRHSRKLIPSYIGGRFVCREDESRPFDMREEMTKNLDLFTPYDERLTTSPSKGESFPIPIINEESFGELYLRCDEGNPGVVFDSIEAVATTRIFSVYDNPDVKIDNICMKYALFGVAAGGKNPVVGLTVTNCEIGWIGGNIQHYSGTDPNYPKGKRGTVTRYGNAIEIYGGCDRYTVTDCYIYQSYDAGITHQKTTHGNKVEMTNIVYKNNLIEYCVYSIEYFLEKLDGDTESFMGNIEISYNILRFSGMGWGQQRHNTDTPAHIKGWSYENTAENYRIHHNLFDRAAYRMLHLVARKRESLPKMYENTYAQLLGYPLGQYGENESHEPPILPFDEHAEKSVAEIFGDEGARVYTLSE